MSAGCTDGIKATARKFLHLLLHFASLSFVVTSVSNMFHKQASRQDQNQPGLTVLYTRVYTFAPHFGSHASAFKDHSTRPVYTRPFNTLAAMSQHSRVILNAPMQFSSTAGALCLTRCADPKEVSWSMGPHLPDWLFSWCQRHHQPALGGGAEQEHAHVPRHA